MAKVLLLGVDGLLGSCLESALGKDNQLNLITTSRKSSSDFHFEYSLIGLCKLIWQIQPDIVVNCIAVTSPKSTFINMLKANSILPIHLALLSFWYKFKVIHFSTNAVFSGRHSINYENSLPLPKTWYGFTKLMGDLSCFRNLVIRTSFIGSSPKSAVRSGLIFKLQNLEKGAEYKILDDHIWNGVTTDVLCEIVLGLLISNSLPQGLIHLGTKVGCARETLIKSLLGILDRGDIKITTQKSDHPRNLQLHTTKVRLVSSLWKYSTFSEVPETRELVQKITIFHK